MSVVVRFAPSPTGYLHAGNARIALINWLFARNKNGTFMLRLDDTDTERSTQEYIDHLYEDLKWLGLDYDVFARQTDRKESYQAVQKKMTESGRLYACYETTEELDQKRKLQLAQGKPPIYDRSALQATQKEKDLWEKEGRRPYWRFRLETGKISWDDLVKGPLSFDICHSVSDPVLIKEDGTFLYTLSSVVDDLDFKITHILRGEDHVTNTAVQLQIFQTLNSEDPVDLHFAHIALLSDADGNPLSKRLKSFSLNSLREKGIEPMALNCYLAALGTSETPYITDSLEKLAMTFDLNKIKGGARLDEVTLHHLQNRLFHQMSYSSAAERYPEILSALTPLEWGLLREGMTNVLEIQFWEQILHTETLGDETVSDEDRPYLQHVSEWIQTQELLTEDTWDKLSHFLNEKTRRKGLSLAKPIRVALTGCSHGPELRRLLPILGRDRVLKRLKTP